MAKRMNTARTKPTNALMEFKLTVDGGGLSERITQRLQRAVVNAFARAADQVRLHYTFAVEVRSVSAVALEKRLARRGLHKAVSRTNPPPV